MTNIFFFHFSTISFSIFIEFQAKLNTIISHLTNYIKIIDPILSYLDNNITLGFDVFFVSAIFFVWESLAILDIISFIFYATSGAKEAIKKVGKLIGT